MSVLTHLLFGVAVVGGLVLAAVSGSWPVGVAGFVIAAVAMFAWTRIGDRNRDRWSDV